MSHTIFSKIMVTSSISASIIYLIGLIGLLSCLPQASAFGSGNIPSAAYLKGKAWRHGDIEDTLEGLAKVAGHGGSAIVGAIASALLGSASGNLGRGLKGGKKFTGLDVKRIYFGNWLRDLSQVCDIAGFKAMTPESLVICIMTMGFLSFGYATREFQVTRERLSVYLLTEHIDNPKGYAEGEDPRKYDPRLRPPVDDARELRIDERNGMKMYIASDDQGFDTSTACIRRVFRQCIELGRQAQREGNEEKEHESFRLLGTGLHTLEDFSAHSNWCELALQKLGHKDVFAHVGENVKINSPEGPVPPLVTGTFAGADFCFSMLGEASDKLSSASIADLTAQLDTAQAENNKPGGINLDFIKSIMSKLPLGGNDSEVQNDLDSMDKKKHAFDLDGRIDQLAPEELQAKIWELFKVRDNLMRRIEEVIQGIPGLGEMLENLSLSLAQWIMVTIDPFVRPILLQASSAIGQSSQAVISGNDQWTVFNDPNASDPTHSVLAKDHFSNILNDPAGNISVIIVKYTVGLMVEAWSNDENPDRVIDRILESIHHPNYANRNSKIQTEMLNYMQKWLHEMERDERELTIRSLTKDSIRNHRNQRKTSKSGVDPRLSGGAPSHGNSHPAYQQASMLGGSQSESQHGRTSQSGSAGYAYNQNAGAPSKSKHGDSQSHGQHAGYQTQDEHTGSQSGTQTQHHGRNTANQSSYANSGKDSSPSRFNQSNLNDESRNNSGGYGQGNRVSSSHNQNPEPYEKKTGGAYEFAAEGRHQHSSTYGDRPEQTSYSKPHEASTGHHNQQKSGYGHQSQIQDSYAPHSGRTTTSLERPDDYEQANRRNDYNQSKPTFPQVHAEAVESSYGGRIDHNSDRPDYGDNPRHGATHGSYEQTSRHTFPEADYGSTQSTHGRGHGPAVDAYRAGHDSGRDGYNANSSFPQTHQHQHDSRHEIESTYGNRYPETGSAHDTSYAERYGDSAGDQGYGQTGSTHHTSYAERYEDSAGDQGYGQRAERERINQTDSDYGMNRLNMQDNYSRRN